jgi:ABC-type antimicrobial peptide transport system permease subunit
MFNIINLVIVLIILFITCYSNTFIKNNPLLINKRLNEQFYSYNTARIPWDFNYGVSKLYGQTYFPGDSVYNTPTK